MLLLASEHRGEIEPLLKSFPFKKQRDVFVFDNLAVYINYGEGALNLAFKAIELSIKLDVNLGVLFGYSGGILGQELGSIVSLSRVKLMDKGLNPVSNPIELKSVDGFPSCEGVTLLGGFNFNNDYLSLFGDCIDNESYLFARAFKSQNKPCLIFRLISDCNDSRSVRYARYKAFDLSKFIDFLRKLMVIEKDPLAREILLGCGISDLSTIKGIKRLIEKRRLTFTQRQMLYKKITLNRSTCEKQPFRLKAIFAERGLRVEKTGVPVYRIDDYVPVFHNLKDRVALIYAKKRGELLRKTPDNYTPNGESGYSILMSFNCIYNCAYCFLKGYFKSFNPVVFLNYEDYFKAIKHVLEKDKRRPIYFYAGTFSDPVALSFASNTLIKLIEFFSGLDDDVFLEIRTKSTRVKQFLKLKPSRNVIFAFSLSPQSIIEKYEFYTPSLNKRLKAIRMLDKVGFTIGIRFDPVFCDVIDDYEEIIEQVKDIKNLHSVEIGFLRFDKNDYKRMLKKSPYVLKGLRFSNGMYRYDKHIIERAMEFSKEKLGEFYLCMEF